MSWRTTSDDGEMVAVKVPVRFAPDDHRRIVEAARADGLSLSGFLRQAAMSQLRRKAGR